MTNRSDVLLINPWIYDFAAYNLWIRPLGLLYLASHLRKHGFRLWLIDCLDLDLHLPIHPGVGTPLRRIYGDGKFLKENISPPTALREIPRRFSRYGITPETFTRCLSGIPEPRGIMVTSGMTYWYHGVKEVVKMVRCRFPSVPVVLGGIYATLCPEHAKQVIAPDYLFTGPFEFNFKAILEILSRGEATAVYNEKPESPIYPALDLYPKLEFVPILTSRGCPYKCSYCASHLLFSHHTKRNPHEVAEEIAFWHERHGVIDFAFYDDALLVDAEHHFVPMMEEICEKGLSLRFHTPNGLHAEFITFRVAELMRRAGFLTVRIGLETSDPEKQRVLGFKVSNEIFEMALRNLKQAGYKPEEVGVYLLAGLPGQDWREVKESIKFVLRLGARPYISEYSPIPGTKLWPLAVKSASFDIESEPLFHNNSILPCGGGVEGIKEVRRLRDFIRHSLRRREPASAEWRDF